MNKVKTTIKLTATGRWFVFLFFFLLFSAQNTGNNLLYLVSSCLFTTLLFAIVEVWLGNKGFKAELHYPEFVVVGQKADIICKISKINTSDRFFFRFENSYLDCLPKGQDGFLKTSILLENTGRYYFKHFILIKPGLLGIFNFTALFPDFVIYAVDKLGSGYGFTLSDEAFAEGLQKAYGGEGEFWSLDSYQEGEDSSRINWTVSARSSEEWIVIRSKIESDEIESFTDGDEENKNLEMPKDSFEIIGKSYSEIRAHAYGKAVSSFIYRILATLGALACLGIYNTGFLPSGLPWIMRIMLLEIIIGKPLPNKYHKIIYHLSIPVAVYCVIKSALPGAPDRIVSLLEFSAIILVLKLLTMKTARHSFGALTLVFMIVLGIAAMNVNSTFPVVFVPFLILASMVLSFYRYNLVATDPEAGDRVTVNAKGLLGTIALLIVFLLLWIPTFYLIPRTTSYGIATDLSKGRQKGFSGNTMSLKGSGLLEDNQTVVMRIKPIDEMAFSASIIRRMGKKLIRGGTFAEYDDGEWKKFGRGFSIRDLRAVGGEYVVDKTFTDFKSLVNFEMIVEGSEITTIFVPEDTKLMTFRTYVIGKQLDDSIFFLDNRMSATRKYNASMLIDSPEIIDSDASLLQEVSTERSIIPYLSLNGCSDRIIELANHFMERSSSILDRVQMVTEFLQKTCEYSLDQPKLPQGVDPVDHFIFDGKAGSCQHFATAMVFMLRSMGIPSRVVNGYKMGEWNEVGEFFAIRQADAHAWVEVFFPEMGWVEFDPTPAEDSIGDYEGIRAFFLKLKDIYEGFWFNYVYSFDFSAQTYGSKKLFPKFREQYNKLKNSAVFWSIIVILGILAFVYRKPVVATIRFIKRKNKWIPYSYILWETGFKTLRLANETPKEYHKRLLESKILSNEAEGPLSQVENLIDELGFSPNVDRRQNLTEIKALLNGLSLGHKVK